MNYTQESASSTGTPQDVPNWIVFRAGHHEARLPVEDSAEDTWRYVLDMVSLGFRADRVGDAIIFTGRPSDMEVRYA